MRRLALLATLGLAGGAAAAPPAPGHGAVAVEAVLEGPSLDVTLRAPLETLLGFAREPRSEAEKRAAQALLERLRHDAAMLRPDAAAGCARSGIELRSAALGLGAVPPGAAGAAELEARWRFGCTAPDRLAHVELGFVAMHPRIARVEVRTVGARGAHQQLLRRPAQRLVWPR